MSLRSRIRYAREVIREWWCPTPPPPPIRAHFNHVHWQYTDDREQGSMGE